MRYAGIVTTLLIVTFWATMNTLLVQRQDELKELDRFQLGLREFLGTRLERERWMGIYEKQARRRKKIGYAGCRVEKVPAKHGVQFHVHFDSMLRISALGKGELECRGSIVLDDELLPLTLTARIRIGGIRMRVMGVRRDGKFRLSLHNATEKIFEADLPLRYMDMGNGLLTNLPMAGFEVGDSFKVPCFDPVALSPQVATVNVRELRTEKVDGMVVEVFVLESQLRGIKSVSHVTRDGTLLRQEFGAPLEHIYLRRESPKLAKAGLAND